jgi:hypothetical protein
MQVRVNFAAAAGNALAWWTVVYDGIAKSTDYLLAIKVRNSRQLA